MANTHPPPVPLRSFPSHELSILQIDGALNHLNPEECDAKREVADEPCPRDSPTLP